MEVNALHIFYTINKVSSNESSLLLKIFTEHTNITTKLKWTLFKKVIRVPS